MTKRKKHHMRTRRWWRERCPLSPADTLPGTSIVETVLAFAGYLDSLDTPREGA